MITFSENKKPILIVVSIGVVFTLSVLTVIFFLYKNNSPEKGTSAPILSTPNILPTPFFTTTDTLKNVEIIWNLSENISLPKNIPIYGFETYGVNSDIMSEIARSLNLTNEPTTLNDSRGHYIYLWQPQDKSRSLLINSTSRYIEYSLLGYQGKPDTGDNYGENTKTDEMVISIAREFLNLHNLNPSNLDLNDASVQYVGAHAEEADNTPREEALIYRVNFNLKINNYDLLLSSANGGLMTVDVDIFGNVRKAVTQLPPVLITNKTAEIISLNDAISMAESGLGTIKLETAGYPQPTPTNINALTINSARLVYLDDKVSGLLLPVVLFSGYINNEPDSEYKAYIYINGVKY